MRLRLRRPSVALLAAALAALAITGTAGAKSFTLPQAAISVQVAKDGSLLVDEHITYAFSGPFSGGFRDIPLRDGESIDRVRVTENGRTYRPGGCTELGCIDAAGTYGTAKVGNSLRVVWHYGASRRAPHLHGALSNEGPRGGLRRRRRRQPQGVGLRVGSSRSTASPPRRSLPARCSRRGATPSTSAATSSSSARRCCCGRSTFPPGQFVELRTVIPRSAFSSTAGMRVVAGNGLAKIVAEETADAAAFEKDQERIDNAKAHPLRYGLYLLLLGTIPAFLDRRRGLLVLRPRAEDRLRPRVRAGAADRDGAGARADAAAPGRRAGLVRVHRDPLRPDPPRRLHLDAGHDRAQDLGRAAKRERLGSRARPRQGRREAHAVGERRRARRRGRDQGRAGAALELPRADRGRPDGDEQALHVVQGERRHRGRQPQVVHLARCGAARHSASSCSSGSARC